MRKMLQNKKGFTLVELMIVVVIMGILVAVAIPVYNSVTKNAKRKTCQTNIKTVTSTVSQYQMSGNSGDEYSWTKLAEIFDGSNAYTALPADFTNLFADGLPLCPSDASEGASKEYQITVTDATDPGTISVVCQSDDNADHNPA